MSPYPVGSANSYYPALEFREHLVRDGFVFRQWWRLLRRLWRRGTRRVRPAWSLARAPRPLQSLGVPATPAGWADPGSAAGAVHLRRPRRRSGHRRRRRRGGLRWLGGRVDGGTGWRMFNAVMLRGGPVAKGNGLREMVAELEILL
jgi:hypothetical protein